MKNCAGHLNQLRRENFSLASTIHRWLAGGDGEPLWLISGCPGCLYWAVTGRDLVRDSSSRGEREPGGRLGQGGRLGRGGRAPMRLSGRPVVPLPDTECADRLGSFLGETRPQTVVCCLVCEEPPFCLRSYKRPFRVRFGTSLLYVGYVARKSAE